MPSDGLLRHHPDQVDLRIHVVREDVDRQEEVVALLHKRQSEVSTSSDQRLVLAAEADLEPMTGKRRNAQRRASYVHDVEVTG
eukprot:351263-Heterocapsa_arctica.AAC.1